MKIENTALNFYTLGTKTSVSDESNMHLRENNSSDMEPVIIEPGKLYQFRYASTKNLQNDEDL